MSVERRRQPGVLRRPPRPSPRDLRAQQGAAVERVLAGGEGHLYHLPLTAGDFLHVVVDQRGVDVAVRLAVIGRDTLLEVDSPSDDLGPETLLAVAAETGEHVLAVRAFPGRTGRYAVAVRTLRPATPEDRARAAAAAAFAAAEAEAAAGRLAAAETSFRRSAAAWRRLGDAGGEGHVEDRLGRLATRRNDADAAAGHHRRAAVLFAAAGEERWRGISLTLLGTALFDRGEPHEARRCFDEALALRRAARDSAGEATLLHNLGHVHELLGEPGRALELYERLDRWRQRGEEDKGRATLHNLGVLLLTLGLSRRGPGHVAQSGSRGPPGGRRRRARGDVAPRSPAPRTRAVIRRWPKRRSRRRSSWPGGAATAGVSRTRSRTSGSWRAAAGTWPRPGGVKGRRSASSASWGTGRRSARR